MQKHVTERQGSTELVVRAAETHAERIGKTFEAEFSRYVLGRERMPDIGLAMKLVARALRDRRKTLTDAHDREIESSRGTEDDPTAKLSAELAWVRVAVERAYGPAGTHALGLDEKPEVEPAAILAQARSLVARLSAPEAASLVAVRRGFHIHPQGLIDELSELIELLDLSLQRIASGASSGPAAREAKARAISANDDLFSRGAEYISAAFRLLGDEELARKLRPSSHRPGRTADDDEVAGPRSDRGGSLSG